MKEKWNKIYKKRFNGVWYPRETIVKFVARYVQRRMGVEEYLTRKKVKRVLDVGCGNGRHIKFFAEQGFDVFGIDISKEAIDLAGVWLKSENLKADLKVGTSEKLPYEDEYFDIVLLDGVLDHIKFSNAKKTIEEVKRVLAPKGYLFLKLRSTLDSEFERGKKVDYHTFILEEGYEGGEIQHFFDSEEIKELLNEFKIFDMVLIEEKFPRSYTVDKAFLQSSRGEKKYVDASIPLKMELRNCEWHIAAEKGDEA